MRQSSNTELQQEHQLFFDASIQQINNPALWEVHLGVELE